MPPTCICAREQRRYTLFRLRALLAVVGRPPVQAVTSMLPTDLALDALLQPLQPALGDLERAQNAVRVVRTFPCIVKQHLEQIVVLLLEMRAALSVVLGLGEHGEDLKVLGQLHATRTPAVV